MKFTVISEISHIQLIANGNDVDIRHYLNRTYAGGRRVHWRKLKGRATVEYVNGEIWEVALVGRMRRISKNFGDSHEVRSLYQE